MIKNEDGTVKFDYINNKTEPLTEEQLEEEIILEGKKKFNKTYVLSMKKRVGEVKLKDMKIELTIQKNDVAPLPLNETQIKDAKAKLDDLDNHDENRLKSMERRNFLESYLFDKKEWLETKEALTVKNYLILAFTKRIKR